MTVRKLKLKGKCQSTKVYIERVYITFIYNIYNIYFSGEIKDQRGFDTALKLRFTRAFA